MITSEQLMLILMAVLGLFTVITNTEKMCPRGTFLYISDEGTETCQNCTEGVNFMSYRSHRETSCFDCTKFTDQLEVNMTDCNKTHDAEILCIHGYYRYKAKNVEERDHCRKCTVCDKKPTIQCQNIHDTLCCDGPNDVVVFKKDGLFCRKLCQPGEYLDNVTEHCITCPSGTYMTQVNHSNTACDICQTLPNLKYHQVILQACNSSHPTIVGCEYGYFRDHFRELLLGNVICLPCRKCQHLGRACDKFYNSVCCSEPHMIVVDTVDGPECTRNHTTDVTTNALNKSQIITDISGIQTDICRQLLMILSTTTVVVAATIIPMGHKIFRLINSMDTVTLLKLKLGVAEVIIAVLILQNLLQLVATSSLGDATLWIVLFVLLIFVLVSVYTVFSTFTPPWCKVKVYSTDDSQLKLIRPEGQNTGSDAQEGFTTKANFPSMKTLIREYKETKLYTALQIAIERGADVNATDDTQKTILMYAAEHRQTYFLNVLLTANADVTMRDNSGNTALAYAALSGCDACVNELFDFGAQKDINKPNNDGITLLMMAVSSYSKNEEFPNLFINAGADVHIQDNYGNTALVYAVKRGHTKWVQTLITAGASKDVNMSNKEGVTAAMLVVSSYGDDDKLLGILLQAGAEVNVRDKDGNTLLALAAKSGNAKCVIALIEAGLKDQINDQNTQGVTPLMLAVSSDVSSNSCPEILLHAGVNIDFKDQDGNTALFYAVRSRNVTYVKVLIKAGAQVSIVNNDGNTPLLLAASSRESNSWCVQILLKAGADINARDRDGQTALDLANKALNDANVKVITEFRSTVKSVLFKR